MSRNAKKKSKANNPFANPDALIKQLRNAMSTAFDSYPDQFDEVSTWSNNRIYRELFDLIDSYLESIPPELFPQGKAASGLVKFTKVDPEETIVADVTLGSAKPVTATLNFRLESARISGSCDCQKHQKLCSHLAVLTKNFFKELSNFDSAVCELILGKEGAVKAHQEHIEREKAARIALRKSAFRLMDTPAFAPGLLQGKSLDEVSVKPEERLIWNLQLVDGYRDRHHRHLSLKPILQKEKKAGGWTKGREMSLESFVRMSRDRWSAIDKALDAEMYRGDWSDELQIDCEDAFPVLEGSDVLYLNRVPVKCEVLPFELSVIEQPVKSANGESQFRWRLVTGVQAFALERDASFTTMFEDDGLCVCSEELAWVGWMPFGGYSEELCRLLHMRELWFEPNERELLLKKVESFDSAVRISLPPSLVGDSRPETIEQVLLLRLRKTGEMNATMCVRTEDGFLRLPGEGQLSQLVKNGDETIQIVRDAKKEQTTARQFAHQLQLDLQSETGPFSWHISSSEDAFQILQTAGQLVDSHSLSMAWHKETAKQINVVGSLSAKNVSVKVTKQRDWFGMKGTCRIAGEDIALKDVLGRLQGAASMNGMVEVKEGQWAAIADDFRMALQQLADAAHENRGKLQLDRSAAMALSQLEENKISIEADKAWSKCIDKVREVKTISPDPPASLNCDLRDYQLEGFRWMCRLQEWGVGAILADDMGLGKTVQTLAVLLQRIETGPALVIAPTSLGFNWESECRRFAPSLNPRLLRDADRRDLVTNAAEGDVVICSYGLALREAELLRSVDWGTLVLDEAQNVKNSNTKTAKEIRQLTAGWKVALTGTPMENHLGELWSIFRAVSPGILGSWEQFRKKFAAPIEKENNAERKTALASVVSPFLLRRNKREVLTDLPERQETNLLVELSNEEQERYDQIRLAAIGELDSLDGAELSSDQRFKVLQLLTRLRQISCHVRMVDETWTNGSSKLKVLIERLTQLKERGHRTLIFSQFTSHLSLIRSAVEDAGLTYLYLDGQTTPKARQKRVDEFQNGESNVFLISLKAGGTGLNLTAADYVIHMDPWWNPAVEDQATDRAHRIGQTKQVMVYRLIAKGTIEEQIIQLHEEKRDLVEGVLSGTEASAKLSTDELASLIRDGVARSKV